jgi:hypothetical protein
LITSTADLPADQELSVHGVVLANNVHMGWIQRYRWHQVLTSWARLRVLVDRAPARASGDGQLSEHARFRVRARAEAAEDASGVSLMVGGLATYDALNLRWGIGYGTWFLPWIDLPVGQDTVTADLDVYWRF